MRSEEGPEVGGGRRSLRWGLEERAELLGDLRGFGDAGDVGGGKERRHCEKCERKKLE